MLSLCVDDELRSSDGLEGTFLPEDPFDLHWPLLDIPPAPLLSAGRLQVASRPILALIRKALSPPPPPLA